MQNQNSLFVGMGSFFLIAVILIAFMLLGADLDKLKWVSRPIAEAQADQIAAQTETQRKRDEIEVEKLQKLADQEVQAQAARDAEALAFQQNIHAAMVFGAQLIAILLGLGLFTACVFASIGLNPI
jgi:thiol:disulfide interchange protein